MDITIVYAAVAASTLGIVILTAAPRLIRSLLTPSLARGRTVYSPARR